MIVNCYIGTMIDRTPYAVQTSSTLREACEEANFDFAAGQMQLDGATLRPGDIDKTFDDFGITQTCYLIRVAKLANARQ